MKLINGFGVLLLVVGSCLAFGAAAAAPAFAENWVRVVDNPGGDPEFIDIDVDSINKKEDGLVYFHSEEDMGFGYSAVDCQQQLAYHIGDGDWDWRSIPTSIVPGSDLAKQADFVCSRA